jgi:hypothetical protein
LVSNYFKAEAMTVVDLMQGHFSADSSLESSAHDISVDCGIPGSGSAMQI